ISQVLNARTKYCFSSFLSSTFFANIQSSLWAATRFQFSLKAKHSRIEGVGFPMQPAVKARYSLDPFCLHFSPRFPYVRFDLFYSSHIFLPFLSCCAGLPFTAKPREAAVNYLPA